MNQLNRYIENADLSSLKNFFNEHGTLRQIKKKACFCLQNSKPLYMGFVESGLFRYVRIDLRGNEHILGYAFQNEYIGDYAACLRRIPSLVTIQAVINSSVLILPFDAMYAFWDSSMKNQRSGRVAAEQLFVQMYERVISLHCETAEERYRGLINQCPAILNILTLKEIALYLSVTPETVSHIRKKTGISKKS